MEAVRNSWLESIDREVHWLLRIRTMPWPYRQHESQDEPIERVCVRFDAIPRLVRVSD